MRGPFLCPYRHFSTWGFLRLFFVLIAIPAITVSLITSLSSGCVWLVSYGQPALVAYFLVAMSLILSGSILRICQVSKVIAIQRHKSPDWDFIRNICAPPRAVRRPQNSNPLIRCVFVKSCNCGERRASRTELAKTLRVSEDSKASLAIPHFSIFTLGGVLDRVSFLPIPS